MKRVEMLHDSDCSSCSIAAILELPRESVPDFWGLAKDNSLRRRIARRLGLRHDVWMKEMQAFLAPRGWTLYYSGYTYNGVCPRLWEFLKEEGHASNTFPPPGYWLGRIHTVDGLRDEEAGHMVVMKGREVVFNPGPAIDWESNEDWLKRWHLVGYYLLVPLDPARLVWGK